MDSDELLTMSIREIDRLKVIHEVQQGKLLQRQAGEQLNLSRRQVIRICRRVREEGNRGIIHRLRGRISNHGLNPGLLKRAVAIVKSKYPDFGPTFANEKLLERHGIKVSTYALRQGMIQTGLWRAKRHKPVHRSKRPRRACVGELVQLDGSDHDWFEGRGPRCVFIPYVDDATSNILHGEFAKVEDTLTLMRLTRNYLRRRGRPPAIYVDKDSIYRINRDASIDEQLRDEKPLTQFTRAMKELGIEVICAHSPQAKGRVERGFKTHQDRLVKELRLAGVCTIEQANAFLRKTYIRDHNRRFSVEPANKTDAHRRLLPQHRLDRILSLRTERTVFNDYTVRYKNYFFQILKHQPVRVKPGDKLHVEIRLDGSMHLLLKGAYLNYKTIPKRPYRPYLVAQPSRGKQREHKGVAPKPAKDHPWRRFFVHGPYRSTVPVGGAGPS